MFEVRHVCMSCFLNGVVNIVTSMRVGMCRHDAKTQLWMAGRRCSTFARKQVEGVRLAPEGRSKVFDLYLKGGQKVFHLRLCFQMYFRP
jgi:hypothetical protein